MLPTDIKLHRQTGILELTYPESSFKLSAELLRVQSPSAEVRGHGPGQEVLQYGKKNVLITQIETVGNYALKFHFDDEHNSGIYTWEYLKELCENQESIWKDYLAKLKAAAKSREPLPEGAQVVNIEPLKSS